MIPNFGIRIGKALLFLLFAINISAQNLSEVEIRDKGIRKITTYYQPISIDRSTDLDLEIVKTSQVKSIKTFDELGRNAESTLYFTDSISTTQTYDYTDSLMVSVSKNISNGCHFYTRMCFKKYPNFRRSQRLNCEDREFTNVDRLVTTRRLNQQVVLFDDSEESRIVNYHCDRNGKFVQLWSENNHFQLPGNFIWVYDTSFKLIKILSFDDHGYENSENLVYPGLANCFNDGEVNAVEPETTSHSNGDGLQIQTFTKLVLNGKDRSHVFTYEYNYW